MQVPKRRLYRLSRNSSKSLSRKVSQIFSHFFGFVGTPSLPFTFHLGKVLTLSLAFGHMKLVFPKLSIDVFWGAEN